MDSTAYRGPGADVAAVNLLARTISVLLGKGDGSFQPARSVAAGQLPGVVGDWDGNGKLDVAVSLQTSGVAGLWGKSDGSFWPATAYADVDVGIAAADLDEDGAVDLIAGDRGLLNVLRGQGDGTFSAPVGDVFLNRSK